MKECWCFFFLSEQNSSLFNQNHSKQNHMSSWLWSVTGLAMCETNTEGEGLCVRVETDFCVYPGSAMKSRSHCEPIFFPVGVHRKHHKSVHVKCWCSENKHSPPFEFHFQEQKFKLFISLMSYYLSQWMDFFQSLLVAFSSLFGPQREEL